MGAAIVEDQRLGVHAAGQEVLVGVHGDVHTVGVEVLLGE